MASVGCQLVPKDVTIVRTLASNRCEVTGCTLTHVRQQVVIATPSGHVTQIASNDAGEHTQSYNMSQEGWI